MTDDAPPPPTADQPLDHPAGSGSAGRPGSEAEALVTARGCGSCARRPGNTASRSPPAPPQLGELAEQLRQTGTLHADLAAAVSEDLAPRVIGLQQVLTEELAQLRGDVDVLLTERKELDKNKNAPVDWASLTEEQAAVQWPILARWVGEVLVPRYELTRDELPDCWALHPPVVAELSWLRTAYVAAYLPRSPPQLGADWHTRWRPAVLTRIRELIKPDECSPGKHAPRRGAAVEAAAQNGTLPRTQLAEPQSWWPFYDRAFHLDLALRRARAAAGEFDWSPCPQSA